MIRLEHIIHRMNQFKVGLPILPWHWLVNTSEGFAIKWKVLDSWESLLADTSKKEQHYRSFLAQHPAFFFHYFDATYFVLTEIRLGGDLTIDFVVGTDLESRGFMYELIEIESPHVAPFTRSGDPSARLSHAIRQVTDWKAWLRRDLQRTRDLFPACSDQIDEPYFTYKIIMGNRDNSRPWLDKRNTFSEELGIEIRSFDFLRDRCFDFHPFRPDRLSFDAQEDFVPLQIVNAIRNPFYVAYTDKSWRKLRRELYYAPHLIALNADIFLKYRSYHTELLEMFLGLCEEHPREIEKEVSEFRERRERRISGT